MLYKSALAKGEDVYITEKHRTIGPMLVDLDFRFDPVESHEKPVRTYTTATIDAFANLLGSCVSHYVDKETFDIFVLEKPSGPTSIKSLVKDGLHFQIPDIVTRPGVQYVVRADVLKGMPAVLDHLNLVNRYEDVLDESIIERNNWLMYMSKKPGSCPYLVTRVLRYRASDKVLQDVTADTQLDAQSLTDRFSIQNKFEETPIREERLNDVIDHEQQMQEKRKRRELVQTVLTNQPVTSNNICENLEVVCKLVDILDASRGESYNDWVRVGWCLRNIDHRLLDKWIEFSRRSPKYVEGECARMWMHMRMGGLGMGTLHIQHHVSGTHYDIARVVHHMYRYEYVCSSLRNRTWYEFRNHRWHYSDSACSLRKRLSTYVFNEYAQCALYHQHKAVNGDSEQEAQKRNVEMCNKLNAIALKLKTTNFKDNIIKERFHIWMVSGCNGKSLSVELFDKALGDYTCKFPVTLLTQKRAASNAATSEIARAKGRRFACLQEPSEDERLNIGLLKELTGGDKVQACALYKEPVEFKPQWHIALLCNHLPHVPSDDGGTWRRIRVVEFTSKFVEFPKNANEFPIDLELSEKLDEWKEPFMSLLIEYYKTRYAKKKIKEPDAVLACTREYQKNNDHFADFVDTCIQKTSPSGVLRMSDAFSEFRSWVKDDNIPIRVPKKKDVQKYLDHALGKPSMENGDVCYRGFSVRDRGGGFSNKGGADYDD
ncbi:putative helicase [Tetrabaena socialis]|uniref:Putative helicase n=1 Tax=Tetrabaena socialis TaxID=47790 RepID=A0A2J7ZJF0_9CHLO|nr:putative helicase [Tetrabaena socialis]|eukprot:PNH00386.1 putative helicase [Tetrabaena socialis]